MKQNFYMVLWGNNPQSIKHIYWPQHHADFDLVSPAETQNLKIGTKTEFCDLFRIAYQVRIPVNFRWKEDLGVKELEK
jgi:hypothetical protein